MWFSEKIIEALKLEGDKQGTISLIIAQPISKLIGNLIASNLIKSNFFGNDCLKKSRNRGKLGYHDCDMNNTQFPNHPAISNSVTNYN